MSALIAIWVDPGEVRSVWVYALLTFYISQGTAIIFLLRSRQQSTPSFRMLVHAADIIWPAVICLMTTSQSNSFFLFFLFVLAAAAYRWGVWETVMTSILAISLLWLESLALHLGAIHPINVWLTHHRLPLVNADVLVPSVTLTVVPWAIVTPSSVLPEKWKGAVDICPPHPACRQ